MSNTIAIQEILSAIILGETKIKKSIELSTLEESCGISQIHVDNTLENKDYTITITSIVSLFETKNGCLFSEAIDQNTENTYIIVNATNDDAQFLFNNELYDSIEIATNNEFHNLILNSDLSSLDMKTVNSMLNQIIVTNIDHFNKVKAEAIA